VKNKIIVIWFLLALDAADVGLAQVSSITLKPAVNSSNDSHDSVVKQKEKIIMGQGFQSGSRPAPPVVASIEHNGIRYEQDMQSYDHGGDQPGGYLTAIDVKTGERLWMVKVYEVSDQSESGVDIIGIYFKSMALIPGRDALEIEDETGRRFIFDLIDKTSDQVSETPIDTLGPIKIPQ
jgi:hypothetical protein